VKEFKMNFNNYRNNIFSTVLPVIISLFIIFSAVKVTLMFKTLYYLDIEYLNIEKESNFSRDEIIKNYDYVIDYLLNQKEEKFNLPSIPYTNNGAIHFEDVKNLFTAIDYLLVITGIFSAIGIYYNIKNRRLGFLKTTSSLLIILPIVLFTVFIIDFDSAFTTFHKIFFSNDYWLFNPRLDQIINILPQEFFYHCAIVILTIIFIFSVSLRIIYKKIKLYDRKKSTI
jgi:integral membrane protein (TIGR01906 family)